MHQDFRQRIYELKVTLVAIISFVVGLALLILSGYAESRPGLAWVAFWQINSIGGTLLAAGLFGIVWDYFDGKDKEARDTERLKRVLAESSTELKDAVIEGFAVGREDLERVATPELLDSIATNALGLRLKDPDFAREIYQGVRDQVINSPEKWHDVDVAIRLSSIEERNAKGVPRVGGPAFDVTITWAYTVIPSSPVHKFACTSDRMEFHELISDIPSTSTWFMTPRPGIHANERSAYELLEYTVDGEPRSIRRSERKSGQTYSVTIGDDVVRAGRPVRIQHTYRTITAKSGHMLMVAIAQPTKNLILTCDYTNTDIASIRINEMVSSARRPRVSRSPLQVPGKEIVFDVSGWVLPKAEVSVVWTLASELPVGSGVQSTLHEDSSFAA